MAARSDADLDELGWFFENSRDLFVATRGGLITRVNPAWTSATGWSSEEAVGRPLADFCHRDDFDRVTACAHELRESGAARIAHRIRSKSGWWVRVGAQIRSVGENGAVMVMHDLGRPRAPRIEPEQHRRAADLIRDAAGVRLWAYDPDHAPDGPPEAAPLGEGGPDDRARLERIHPADRAAVQAAWTRTRSTGEPASAEYRRRRDDDGWAWLRATWRGVGPAIRGGWRVMGVTHDVTELVEAREAALQGERAAQAAAEAKSHFVANISHEIRTPMNGVLGVLHLLRAEDLSAEGRRLLEEALTSGRMLAELLADVIDFADIEAGRLSLACEPVDLTSAVESVISLVRHQAEAKGLRLTMDLDPRAGWIMADPVRLRQILFNLAGNAVKFTDQGGVQVRMRLRGQGARRRLRLEVEDTGIGVAPEVADRLFEGFHQADNSMTRRHGGSGLGLAICQRLARLMKGRVGYSSQPGLGSVFWIEMPAAAVAGPTQPVNSDEQPLAGVRVLVVEDNPTNRLIVTKMLEKLGAVVETADDGAQGVEAARRQLFDLIMMDIQMPVMDGVTAARAIRALPGEAGEIPILAVTANALTHQVDAYRRAGMDGYLAKPFSPAELLRELTGLTVAERLEPDRSVLRA